MEYKVMNEMSKNEKKIVMSFQLSVVEEAMGSHYKGFQGRKLQKHGTRDATFPNNVF